TGMISGSGALSLGISSMKVRSIAGALTPIKMGHMASKPTRRLAVPGPALWLADVSKSVHRSLNIVFVIPIAIKPVLGIDLIFDGSSFTAGREAHGHANDGHFGEPLPIQKHIGGVQRVYQQETSLRTSCPANEGDAWRSGLHLMPCFTSFPSLNRGRQSNIELGLGKIHVLIFRADNVGLLQPVEITVLLNVLTF